MQSTFLNNKSTRILLLLVLFMALLALGSYTSLNFEKKKFANPSPAVISVTGEGEVLAVPDVGQFYFSVTASGEDAAQAQEASGTKINSILAYLKEQEIEDKDVKTQNYNFYPKWKYEERICPIGSYCPGGERVQDGFEVTQSVTVKVRDTDTAGAIIAGVGERGATNISSLNFTIDDVDVLREEARAAAIKDAQNKADILAKQLEVRIARLISFNEGGGYYPQFAETRAMSLDMAEESGFGGAELPVGEQSTKVNVTLVFEVK